jgi:hypothetical protein
MASPAMASRDTSVASSDSWAGWIVFAGFVLIIVGGIDVLQGLVAIVKDDYVVATPKGVAIVDVTTWGWTTLVWGVLLVLAGLGLLGGAGWARWLAIIEWVQLACQACSDGDLVHPDPYKFALARPPGAQLMKPHR